MDDRAEVSEIMEEIPETRLALAEMSRFQDEDLTARFGAMANRVGTLAPDCLGLTLSFMREGLACTWIATGLDVASLDAVQYLSNGPCIESMGKGAIVATPGSDPLDEDNWLLFSRAENAAGVESTLSVPLMEDHVVVGGVNFYGSTPTAFDGLHSELAAEWGGWSAGAVTNADLSLSGVRRAQQTPQTMRDQFVTDQAVGMIMAAHRVADDTAGQRLHEAAQRAGIHDAELARILVKTRLL
ncbi:ANTAR domain-containing protein [Pedococcus bigeumensis]|uniref:ANTAR domain-containing protein n=1 Tax=Pedococcus bigeumensis TaxID=433644 RepID=UPI0019D5ED7F|nr:ANTAR domain-containing protein [Pedococcus bigeumensis]